METQKDNGKGSKHVWTTQEDNMLVECLVQLKTNGKFVADTGFSVGYLKRLEDMLEVKLPSCGLKANPHIMSRLRTIKKQWQIVHDMVHNKNTSGFGWDPIKKCVTAEDHVWTEYVKVKKEAGNFRNRCLSHFEELSYVWAKDRADGTGAEVPISLGEDDEEDSRIEAEVNAEQVHNTDTNSIAFEQQPSQPTDVHLSAKRKRRSSRDAIEVLADALKESSSNMDNTMMKFADNLCKEFAEMRKDSRRFGPVDVGRAEEIFRQLMRIPGLTWGEINKAHSKITESSSLAVGFSLVPENEMAAWVYSLLE
ncbi:uncharacterized protein At2g29880-like [Neltuma alba]|uniref:uncharacterized protein At2g29880-like n=1 Tax=Neltuma alba TaxID=207710 RepID=UPI0010A3E72B|nr:uncharacterized protein At2g29880-like [Prosopis alba]